MPAHNGNCTDDRDPICRSDAMHVRVPADLVEGLAGL